MFDESKAPSMVAGAELHDAAKTGAGRISTATPSNHGVRPVVVPRLRLIPRTLTPDIQTVWVTDAT